MIENFIHDGMGLAHSLIATLAMLLGAYMLVAAKGTRLHKRLGYAYAVMMLVVNATALSIYRLYGYFGLFHWLALASLITLGFGILPLMIGGKSPRNMGLHFSFMFWSVVGLYAAFVSELITRIPETPFYGMLGIANGVVFIIATIIFMKWRPRWAAIWMR